MGKENLLIIKDFFLYTSLGRSKSYVAIWWSQIQWLSWSKMVFRSFILKLTLWSRLSKYGPNITFLSLDLPKQGYLPDDITLHRGKKLLQIAEGPWQCTRHCTWRCRGYWLRFASPWLGHAVLKLGLRGVRRYRRECVNHDRRLLPHSRRLEIRHHGKQTFLSFC